MNKIPRIILHIDMNCFFASCEIAVDEDLRGLPIIVAHNDPLDRGLIVSPSYEARAFGIKTTMHVKDAKKLCPEVVVVEPTYGLYQEMSHKFKEYLLKITDKVEMASIDEAYVDISSLNLGDKTIELAKKIQNDLLKLYKLPCSIGIAPNKLLAKMGSDYKKPLGITVMRKRDIDKMLWPLDIGDMMYIGKKTAPRLREMGIKTIGDLANFKDIELLKQKFGENFVNSMIPKCWGNDDSPVITERELQTSYSHAHTFMSLIINKQILLDTLHVLTNELAYDMQNDKQLALNIGIQIKDGNFNQKNISKPLNKATNNDFILFNSVKDIFDDFYTEGMGIRLIGVFSNRIIKQSEAPKQISIFDNLDEVEKESSINKLIDSINKEFGSNSIKKGIK